MTQQDWEDRGWAEFAGDEFVQKMRDDVLDTNLPAYLVRMTKERIVEQRWNGKGFDDIELESPPRSALLTFGQYWADNADDEVHGSVFLCSKEAPDWPPERDSEGEELIDKKSYQISRWDHSVTPGYGELIPAFEAFCHEDASQEDDYSGSHRPFAVARFNASGKVEVEIVGRIVRGWLDMPQKRCEPGPSLDDRAKELALSAGRDPRAIPVLGDVLLEAEDPRGEILTHLHMPAELKTLLAAHGRKWLGSADAIVPRAGVRFERGIPAEVQLYIDPDAEHEIDREDPLPWILGPRVRFLPGSDQRIWPAMKHARALCSLDETGMKSLADSGVVMDATEIEIDPTALDALFEVDALLPKLSVLRITGSAASSALLSKLQKWSRFSQIRMLEIASDFGEDAHVRELRAFKSASLTIPVWVSMLDSDAHVASGWRVTFNGGRAWVERAGYLGAATKDRLQAIERALPALERRAGPYWSP